MSSPLTVREQTGVAIVTTDETLTVAATIGTDANTGYSVRASVLAINTDDYTQAASYVLIAAFKNNAGTLAQVGSTTVVSSLESNAAWDCVFAVSGTDIQIKVTGAAATNISWLVDADVKNLSRVIPNGGIIAN